MAIVTNTVAYMDGDTVLEGFFAVDEAIEGVRPLVLVSHAWGGRDGFVEEKARKLAGLGYVGFALDMYGKGVLGTNAEQNGKLMSPFMADRAKLKQRMLAGLTSAKLLPWADNQNIAAIGFCFGGLCVLDLARSGADIKGVVSFHGLLGSPESTPNTCIKAKVLALHGHDDPMVTPEQVQAFEQEMTQAKVDWQLHVYGQTMHAFTNPMANDPNFGTVYQAQADQRSWLAMKNFLQATFI